MFHEYLVKVRAGGCCYQDSSALHVSVCANGSLFLAHHCLYLLQLWLLHAVLGGITDGILCGNRCCFTTGMITGFYIYLYKTVHCHCRRFVGVVRSLAECTGN